MTNYIFKELKPREDKVYKRPEKLRMILDYNFNAYLVIIGYEIITKKKKKMLRLNNLYSKTLNMVKIKNKKTLGHV